jgi:putative transposase
MSQYRRKKAEGGCYFFTVVAYKRRAFLTDDAVRPLLKGAIKDVQSQLPFVSLAFCLLPDHLHCLWRLPPEDCDYSARWAKIKRLFSSRYRAAGGMELSQTPSRINKREAGIWQRRFWEHRIRDEQDYWRHVHYIHYNPVKHGLVERPEQWPYSTYHQFRNVSLYDTLDWNCLNDAALIDKMEYTE